MEFANTLRAKRKELNLTQQELADQLHVTRQTLSRWENDLSYPNLDTLTELSELLNISLDNLLKGGENAMVKQISKDVRDKRIYKHCLIVIGSVACLVLIWAGILGYGRATQNEWIDRFNPFLKTQYGYAILPNKVPKKIKKEFERGSKQKEVRTYWVSVPQKVDAYVSDDPFGNGSWLKFSTGEYDKQHRWALVKHKGSYVYAIRLIRKEQIPLIMREQAGNFYVNYNDKVEPRLAKNFPWWPFN